VRALSNVERGALAAAAIAPYTQPAPIEIPIETRRSTMSKVVARMIEEVESR
jgi:hypothetical protein